MSLNDTDDAATGAKGNLSEKAMRVMMCPAMRHVLMESWLAPLRPGSIALIEGQKNKTPAVGAGVLQFEMVAGIGFEPMTFRL